MSNPPNPLDKFRTYSYHHFMIAANNTEVLRQIQSKEISFNSLARLKHGEKVNSANNDSTVVMVINSAVDSKFFIDSFSYTSLYCAMSDPAKKFTQASDIKMVVKESGGATFLNFMRDISDTLLQTSYEHVCFMLVTFFVGHTNQGTTEVIQIDPIHLILTGMESSFDQTGGIHTMTYACGSNGAPLQNHNLLYVNRNLNLVTNDNSLLLKNLVKDLETKLNDQLAQQWQIINKDTGNGRKIKYKITLPKDWDHYTVKSLSKDNYVERLFPKEKQAVQKDSNSKKDTGDNRPTPENDRFKSHMDTSVKTTVIQILEEMLKHSDDVANAFIFNSKLKKEDLWMAKLHQIVSSITSDSELITVHIDVINYYLPKLPVDNQETIKNMTKGLDPDTAQRLTNAYNHKDDYKYGIIFEYIFTGANSDILSFDIKANNTNALLTMNRDGVSKALKKAVRPASEDGKEVKDADKKSISIIPMRKYDGVYLPTLSADAQAGYIYASPDSSIVRNEYVNNLALLIATTTMNSHLHIRGNPVFLNQVVRQIQPHNDIEYEKLLQDLDDKAKASALALHGDFDPIKQTSLMAGSPSHIPLFAKIVLKTPIVNETSGEVKYEEFWYKGFYRINMIENKFSNDGKFEQELHLSPWINLNDSLPT